MQTKVRALLPRGSIPHQFGTGNYAWVEGELIAQPHPTRGYGSHSETHRTIRADDAARGMADTGVTNHAHRRTDDRAFDPSGLVPHHTAHR